MHAFRSLLIVGTALLAVACSGGGSAASLTPPPDADLAVTAQGNAFDRAEITLPADEPVKLYFKNLDAAPHNVAIYVDAAATDERFVGETISDAAIEYSIPAIAAGRYVFRCDVHPDMAGTVVVGSGT